MNATSSIPQAGPPETIHRLLYMSSESVPCSRTALCSILDASVRNNALRNVTGLLLYKAGNFLQVLEGAQEAVEGLYQRICGDTRHRQITILLKQDLPKREFPDWSMAFRDLDMEKQRARGYNALLNAGRPATGGFSKEIRVFMRMFESPC